jgi:hypothetical protein
MIVDMISEIVMFNKIKTIKSAQSRQRTDIGTEVSNTEEKR